MAAQEAIITFIFNGEDSDDIPRNVMHLIIHENTVIPELLFYRHPNLVEVYCHAGVLKIENQAFTHCRSLRRVIIPGVTVVEACAFFGCCNLVYVECDKLERIGIKAFDCKVLGSINLPSAKIVEAYAFSGCRTMREAIFGKDLESIEDGGFQCCRSLESITIPLKNGLFTEDNVFKGCDNLTRVDLLEGESLRDFTEALLLESWRNDVNEALDLINQILPDTSAGDYGDRQDIQDVGRKAIAIREWIDIVLRNMIHYKAAHQKILDEAATKLQLSLPNDIVMNSVLSFVQLPALTLDGEDEADE